MNIEIITEDELQAELEAAYQHALKPRLLGFCIGIPGQPCGRRVHDDEIGAVELEVDRLTKKKQGVIGTCCYPKLFPLLPSRPQTTSQVIALKKKAGRASASVDNNRLHIRPVNGNRGKPRSRRHAKTVGILLPGSTVFKDKKPGPEEWRNYPDG